MPDQISLFEGDGSGPKRIGAGRPGPLRVRPSSSATSATACCWPACRPGSGWAPARGVSPGWLGIVYARKRLDLDAGERRPARVRAAPAAQDRRHRPQLLRADPRRGPASLRGSARRRVPVLREGAGRRHLGEHPGAQPAPSESGLPVGAEVHRRGDRAVRRGASRGTRGPSSAVLAARRPEGDQCRRVHRETGRVPGAAARQNRYAVEIRDKWALCGSYRDVLARHGAAHVYNYWSAMPPPGAQARTMPPEDSPS